MSLAVECVFLYQGMFFFTNIQLFYCVYVLSTLKYSFSYVFRKTVLVTIYTPCKGVVLNVTMLTLAFCLCFWSKDATEHYHFDQSYEEVLVQQPPLQ